MDISNISKKFIDGLMNYNLSYNDIIEEGFKYCGGDTGRHANYFKEHFIKDVGPIEHTDYCVCGHGINENCYIINKDLKILILGNCCIKKFIPKSRRTCEICENIHINRKFNICNICIKEYGRPCQLCKKYHKNKGINMCSLCRKNKKIIILI